MFQTPKQNKHATVGGNVENDTSTKISMNRNLGEYQIIDRNIKIEFFNKTNKLIILSSLFIILITIIIAVSNILEKIVPNSLILFFGIGLPVMTFFLLISYNIQLKNFFLSQDKLCFYEENMIVKSKESLIFPIKEVSKIEFMYSGYDEGFYHPTLNKNPKRGDRNYVHIETNKIKKEYEIYIHSDNELKRIKNFLANYKAKGIETRIDKI